MNACRPPAAPRAAAAVLGRAQPGRSQYRVPSAFGAAPPRAWPSKDPLADRPRRDAPAPAPAPAAGAGAPPPAQRPSWRRAREDETRPLCDHDVEAAQPERPAQWRTPRQLLQALAPGPPADADKHPEVGFRICRLAPELCGEAPRAAASGATAFALGLGLGVPLGFLLSLLLGM
jgi:hypothetical protein